MNVTGGLPINADLLREACNGPRYDRNGNRMVTPYRCADCQNDATYWSAERPRWVCVLHWVPQQGVH